MSKTKKILPELRFPEFKDCGEWEEEKLGEVATKNIDKTKGKRCKLMSITAGQGLISQIEKFGREIAGNSYNNYIVIKKDDFVYNKSSTKIYREGEIARYNDNEEGAVPNSIFISFKFDTAKVYPLFAGFLFEKNIHGYWLRKFISMGARAHGALQVNDEDFFAMPLSFPSIPEQQRIAACLSSLDKLISAHSQKLELLKAHKKGLMQNMFPQEGEKVPKLRFKEFENDGEWEIDTVDNLVSTITPHRKLTSSDYQKEGKFPIIDQSKSFYCGWTNDVDVVIKDDLPLIIFGDHTCTLKITNKPFVQGADGIKILKTKNKVIPEFLYQYLQYNEVKQEDYKRHFSILKEKSVLFPKKESGEQQRIASCLSSLDELITAQSKKIEQLKQHKKGLMRGLFPKINE